jgi:hypothetical protein
MRLSLTGQVIVCFLQLMFAAWGEERGEITNAAGIAIIWLPRLEQAAFNLGTVAVSD